MMVHITACEAIITYYLNPVAKQLVSFQQAHFSYNWLSLFVLRLLYNLPPWTRTKSGNISEQKDYIVSLFLSLLL